MDQSVKAVLVNGVEATVDNVLAETYKISRPFIMMYHEKNMTPVTKAYIDFILSEEGQVIVEENGGIPVK
jgi:phosphate transport system substrate-binding protein